MPRDTSRNLPRQSELFAGKSELVPGCKVIVVPPAGKRLEGRTGIVLAPGSTVSQVKVLLDGSKRYITLHVRYIELAKPSDE